MTSRIAGALGPMADGGSGPPAGAGGGLQLPAFLHEPFAAAMSQSMLLPAFVALFGICAALFLVGSDGPSSAEGASAEDEPRAAGTDRLDARTRRVRVRPSAAEDLADGFENSRMVSTTTTTMSSTRWRHHAHRSVRHVGEPRTEPLPTHTEHPRTAPVENWHTSPVESWHSLLDDVLPDDVLPDDVTTTTEIEPITEGHNGFHVDDEPFFDDIDTYGGSGDAGRPAARRRPDPDNGFGRHSHPGE